MVLLMFTAPIPQRHIQRRTWQVDPSNREGKWLVGEGERKHRPEGRACMKKGCLGDSFSLHQERTEETGDPLLASILQALACITYRLEPLRASATPLTPTGTLHI